ncbi:MAG: Strongly-conserved Zn-finger binding protein (TFIIIA) [Chaenotheca gracillima]|nr:MAG: Strongly-conserved Zn-finger binding protein (TFIIIA) [Chaenotheca gracillima]
MTLSRVVLRPQDRSRSQLGNGLRLLHYSSPHILRFSLGTVGGPCRSHANYAGARFSPATPSSTTSNTNIQYLNVHLVNVNRSSFKAGQPLQVRVFQSSSSSSANSLKLASPAVASSNPFSVRVRSLAPSLQLPNLASSTQTRSHGGHSHGHGHHHHHDNTYLVSSNKRDAGVRITRIGLYVNLGMAIVKGVGGWMFNSHALVADAFHALTDLVSDFMTLATISFSMKPPSIRFPGGYGKVESLGALGVSTLLLGGGVLMGWNACDVLYTQFFLDAAAAAQHAAHSHGHGHSHAAADLIPDLNAAWLAAGSIVVKEWLYRATMKVARERKSSVLASNAMHHRIDSLTGFVAFVAIAGSHVLHGASWLDPVGGLIVSLMVIKAGWTNTKMALLELADMGVDDEIKDSVRQATTDTLLANDGATKSGIKIHAIQGVKSGQNYLMEVELSVPGSWTIEQTQPLEQSIRERVGQDVRGVKRLRLRFVPDSKVAVTGEMDFADEFIGPDMSLLEKPEKAEAATHKHEHDPTHDEKHDKRA